MSGVFKRSKWIQSGQWGASILTASTWTVVTLGMLSSADAQDDRPSNPPRTVIAREADAARALVNSNVGKSFLDAAACLPAVQERIVYQDRTSGKALTDQEFRGLPEEERGGFEQFVVDESFYYTSRYGSPIANVRAYDLAGTHGLTTIKGARLCDFGFGSIGSLRMLASLGADVVGTEVSDLLRVAYAEKMDTGVIPPCNAAGAAQAGSLSLAFGRWPADESVRARVAHVAGDGLNLFLSKNTLKRGYIHPTRSFRTKAIGEGLINLGVDDKEYATAIYDSLGAGGLFLIYNLSPKFVDSDEGYIPWADGRCPFERELLEQVGFEVIAFDEDDTVAARKLALALKWNEQGMNLEQDLFAMYTLLRRPQ